MARLVDSTPTRGGVGTATWITATGVRVQVSAKIPTRPTSGHGTAQEVIPDAQFALGADHRFHAVHADGSTTPVTDRHVCDLLERPADYLRSLLASLDQEGPTHGNRL
ncbi:hypothetical protein ACWD2L_00320 [Streptomyces sp. NPDC002754]